MVAKVVSELNIDGVRWELENVVRWLSGAVGDETAAAHDVERELFRKVLELGRQGERHEKASPLKPDAQV